MSIQVKLWYVIRDGGDGSAYVKWFRTEEAFNKFSERDDSCEGFGEFCGGLKSFNVDEKTGEIIPQEKSWSSSFEEDCLEY